MAKVEAAFLLQHNYIFEVDSTYNSDIPTWLRLAGGITSIEFDNNEDISQDYYYDGGGNAESDVIGMQKTIAFEGHRKYGDLAQDFVFSLSNEMGDARRTQVRVTFPDGTLIQGACSIVNIKDAGGDANSKGEVEFEIHFNGLPTVTPAAPSDVKVEQVTATGAALNWSAPTFPADKIQGYKVYVDGTVKATVTTTMYTLSGLTAKTEYVVKVTTVAKNGSETAIENAKEVKFTTS